MLERLCHVAGRLLWYLGSHGAYRVLINFIMHFSEPKLNADSQIITLARRKS